MTGDIFNQAMGPDGAPVSLEINLKGIDFSPVILLDEIDAELKMRHRVYSRQVINKRMSSSQMDRKIAKMEAVRELVRRIKVAAQ